MPIRSTRACAASRSTARSELLALLRDPAAAAATALGAACSVTSPPAFSTAFTSFAGGDHGFLPGSLRRVPSEDHDGLGRRGRQRADDRARRPCPSSARCRRRDVARAHRERQRRERQRHGLAGVALGVHQLERCPVLARPARGRGARQASSLTSSSPWIRYAGFSSAMRARIPTGWAPLRRRGEPGSDSRRSGRTRRRPARPRTS